MSTWVARFVVDHGRVTEEGSRLRTFQRRRLDEPDVDLHAIAEPSGAKGEELGTQALDAIGRLFQQDKLSLTGGLQRALAGTHQTLLEWNRRSLPRDQVSIGVTAALVSGDLVYLAQAGPGLVYVRRSGILVRHEPAAEATVALGEGDLSPSLRRFELEAGDLIVAASSSLQTILDDETLDSILNRPTEEALPELYLLTRDLPNFALFAIVCHAGADESAADDSGAEAELDRPPEYLERSPAERPTPARERVVRDAAVAAPVAEPEAVPEEPLSLVATPPPLDISRPVVRLRSEGSVGRSEYARTTGEPRRLQVNFADWRLLQVGGVIAFILLVVAFVPGLIREGRTEKLATLIANAEAQLASGQDQQDPARRRFLLDETRRLATEALRIEPLNARATELRDQATALLAEMNAVFDLGPLTTVTTLGSNVTGQVSIESVLVKGGQAYLLDSRGGRVIGVPLSGGAPQTVYAKGESYGDAQAKAPIHFTWEGPDDTGRLLILDEERKLFEMHPGSEPRALPLRRTGTWASVAAIATFDDNLYVLDPEANQVHRYLPAAQGFDSEPTLLLNGQIELEDAVAMTIDGDVFVVLEDGHVRRFRNGADAGFPLGGIDQPISAASDILAVPEAQEIYIADTGNKRVVVAGKDGAFHRQLVSGAFTDLRAIATDTTAAQLYVVIGDALLTAPVVR
jgi:hypothetical protein